MREIIDHSERLHRFIFYRKPFDRFLLPLFTYGESFGRVDEDIAAPWQPKQLRGRAAFWLANRLDDLGMWFLYRGLTRRSK